MNPIQLLLNISEMNQVEAFNYCRYELKGKGTRQAVIFYEKELPNLIEHDSTLEALQGSLEKNMNIFKEYLEN